MSETGTEDGCTHMCPLCGAPDPQPDPGDPDPYTIRWDGLPQGDEAAAP